MLTDVGEHSPLWMVPFRGQVILSCIRKPAKHRPVSKSTSNTPLWFLFQDPACLSPVMDSVTRKCKLNKPFLHLTAFGHGICCKTERNVEKETIQDLFGFVNYLGVES